MRLLKPHVTVLLLFVLLILTGGCESVDHVNTYREAREIYNQATNKTNATASSHLLPNDGYDQKTSSNNFSPKIELATGFTNQEYRQSHAQFTEAAILLRALNENNRTRQALVQDQLYGSSATLELLCRWKAAFFAQLMAIDSPANDDDKDGLKEPESIRNIMAARDQLIGRLQGQSGDDTAVNLAIFPRDQFLLAAMESLMRYDNAYIYAVEWNNLGRFDATITKDYDKRLSYVKQIVKAIALAEQKLANDIANAKPAYEEHLVMASVAARQTMLRTAISIVNQSEVEKVTRDDGTKDLWDYDDAMSALPELTSRIDQFSQEACTPDQPAYKFFQLFMITFKKDQTRKPDGPQAYLGIYWERKIPTEDTEAAEAESTPDTEPDER